MGNKKFEDISILKTLAELKSQGLLHPNDMATLCSQLQSEWGRQAAAAMLSNNESAFAQAKSVLRHFSEVA
jgi:hypothetical protein